MDRSADALDALAGRLRDRLVDDAGEASAGDDPAARIGALVEREAGVLDAATRDALAARVAERAVGLGPLEQLLRDPAVDELLVCGTAPVWIERGAALSHRCPFRQRGRAAPCDRADPRTARAPRRRGRAALRRAAARRLARERGAAAAGTRRAAADDPPLPPARVRAGGPARERDARAAAARLPRPCGRRPLLAADLRRHRVGQDDDAGRAGRVRRTPRASGD